jgi:hypothetical protein
MDGVSAASLAVIVTAMAVGAVVKGVTGSGLPTIAIPVMAGFLGVERAVVVMAIPTVVTNSWLLWEHRHHASGARDLPLMLGCGCWARPPASGRCGSSTRACWHLPSPP